MGVLLSCAMFPSAYTQLTVVSSQNSYLDIAFMQELVGLKEISLDGIAAFETYVWHVCQRFVFPEHIFDEKQDRKNNCRGSVLPGE